MGKDDSENCLELKQTHVSLAPVCNGILLPKHILVDGDIHRLMDNPSHLGGPSLVMVDCSLAIEDDPVSQVFWNLGDELV